MAVEPVLHFALLTLFHFILHSTNARQFSKCVTNNTDIKISVACQKKREMKSEMKTRRSKAAAILFHRGKVQHLPLSGLKGVA